MRYVLDITAWCGNRRMVVCADRRERRAVLAGAQALHATHLYDSRWRFLRTEPLIRPRPSTPLG